MTDAEDRARILAQLAQEQDHQRQQHVTELAGFYTHITQLRSDLKITEQSYRAAYRRALTTGLITGPQLRSLGLPPIDARRRPGNTPNTAAGTASPNPQPSN
ncbi:hypothetical protein ACXYX3_27610 (plasmid) [Mycobacterium sp. C3-094]